VAVLWERRRDGVHYQVRSAGRTLRLYSNGVLHTQFNPSRLLTGSVWDLMLLATLLLPPGRVRRVLVLGVGGGAVLRQLLAVYPDAQITGIELNPVHLAVARRFFGLRDQRVQLHEENAITWLALHDGEPFDVIIDDLFGERDGEPCRAVSADADWFDLLASQLAPGGALVMNFAAAAEVRTCDWWRGGEISDGLPYALSLSTPTCENRVVAFLPEAANGRTLARAIRAMPLIPPAGLRYRARCLRPGRG
jgi:spermidine synthase